MCRECAGNLGRVIAIIAFVVVFCAGGAAWGRDFTFFVWSDSHFGAYDYSDTTRLSIIEQMNGLPGREYPEGVHFVVLDAYHWNNTAAPDIDEEQFEWLERDLGKVKGDGAIVIAMHIQPNSRRAVDRTSKPSDRTSERLWDIVSDKNVIAFLHGHWHIVKRTKWIAYDVLAPAGFAYWRKGCPRGQPIFGVVRITDTEMTVLGYDWDKEEFLSAPSLRKDLAKD